MKKAHGFSLIEMLCALLIGLIILSLMMAALLGYRKNFQLNQAIAEMQENARFAVHFMKSEVGQSGYLGCAKLTKDFLIVNDGVDAEHEIHYFNTLKMQKNKYGDMISARHLSSTVGFLQESARQTNTIIVGLTPAFNKGDSIAISDCHKMVLAKILRVYRSKKNNYQKLTLTNSFKQSFAIGAEIRALIHSVFLILSTSRKNKSGGKIFALYQVDGNSRKSELVAGVDLISIDCFVQNSSGSVSIVKASQVLNWDQVKLLKISLLIRSEDEVLDYKKSYWFNEQMIKPIDKRLYQSITFYVRIK